MIVDVHHRCSDFDSYRALRVKSLFNAENGCDWQHVANLPIEDFEWKIGLVVRGAASIRNAYKRGEPITAATWFWANDRYDAGDICEQEIVAINHFLRPREFYEAHIIPAMGRTLERALIAIERGYIRAVPQVEEYSSYD